MDYQQDRIRVICDQLEKLRFRSVEKLSGFSYCPCGYRQTTPPEGPWQEWAEDRTFSGHDAHYWFRRTLETPLQQEGTTLYFFLSTGYEGDWDGVNPQGLLYLDGVPTQGLDINHHYVRLEGGRSYEMGVCMFTSILREVHSKFDAALVTIDDEIEGLYYDLKVPLDASAVLKAGSREYWQILRALEQAAQMVDLRNPLSEAFMSSVRSARAYLKSEFYDQLGDASVPTVHLVGHTHIDVAWMWTVEQTREKVQRSFSTVLRLMEQYPEYKFMSSTPQIYQFIKEDAPVLYEQIKQRVAEGRWEVEGAMWLEADCNLTSGESLVRQILYGKRFMQREFGADSHVLWLPDVFGYSAAMPQILRKSGVDRFFTTKIGWNENNKMPYDAFMWQGIDGTEVFTAFGTAQNVHKPWEDDRDTTYVGNTEPSMVMGAWERFQQKEYSDHVLITFGFGDGGGGPTRHMLEVARRTGGGLPGFPKTEMSFAGELLDAQAADLERRRQVTGRIPRWVGELYLEFHRGTYTSQAKNKRSNRSSEFLLQSAETASVLAEALAGKAYPKETLEKNWQTVLLNQFHDIIPGSSIRQVYDVTDAEYERILSAGKEVVEGALAALTSRVREKGVLVYNPLGFARSGAVFCEGKAYYAENVPAFGWTVLQEPVSSSAVSACGNTLENKYYKLVFDETGAIISLYDKRVGRELCKAGEKLNELRIYEDFPRDYDAWELSRYYADKYWTTDRTTAFEPVDEGVRKGFRMVRPYQDSAILQTVYLYDDDERIDFVTEVDWHRQHQILKAVFPLELHADRFACEIQFGHLYRPTHRNTGWDSAKFEVCAQKWVDLSEHGYGVSLLNDCKYGHSALGSTLTISLLKGATYPDPNADQGHHSFTYSLLPHEGAFQEAGTIRQAYCLNEPLMALAAGGGDGTLPAAFGAVECLQENIVIETLKKAEDGNDLILRFYESFDQRGEAKLTLNLPFTDVYVCDLLEQRVPDAPLVRDGNTVTVPVHNFEIVTLRFVR